jgi:hypothetical protein
VVLPGRLHDHQVEANIAVTSRLLKTVAGYEYLPEAVGFGAMAHEEGGRGF